MDWTRTENPDPWDRSVAARYIHRAARDGFDFIINAGYARVERNGNTLDRCSGRVASLKDWCESWSFDKWREKHLAFAHKRVERRMADLKRSQDRLSAISYGDTPDALIAAMDALDTSSW